MSERDLQNLDNTSKYRQMRNERTGKIEEQKSCPNCGEYKFLEGFGYRNIGGNNIIQSWCRGCRKS